LEIDAMTAADSRCEPGFQEPPAISRGRTIAIVLMVCLAFAALPFQLAAVIAFAFQVPFSGAMHAILTLFGVASFTTVLILRSRSYLTRGSLVADAGKEPRRKLFAWLAAISLFAGVVILEGVRREAQIDPVHSRIQQLLALRKPILDRVQTLLDQQRALHAIVPPDLKEARHVGQLIRQEQAESSGLGNLIAAEIAEEQRLTYRLLPDWTEAAQSFKNLRNGLTTIPSHPWDVLSSTYTLQLYLFTFAFANGLITLLIALSHRQIRENGIWQGGILVRWKLIGSYRWDGDMLVALIGKTQSSITLPIAQEDKAAVENLLKFNLATIR
jgi:hypothetical protein